MNMQRTEKWPVTFADRVAQKQNSSRSKGGHGQKEKTREQNPNFVVSMAASRKKSIVGGQTATDASDGKKHD
jgi:hypothetical protein